jgi:hypothetical protein
MILWVKVLASGAEWVVDCCQWVIVDRQKSYPNRKTKTTTVI